MLYSCPLCAPPVHADAAAAAASGLQHELAPGEQLAEVVIAVRDAEPF
jgi:hypothetical protein